MGPEQITDKFFLGTSAICTPLIKFIANLKEDSSYIFFTKQELFPFSNLSIRIKSLLAALYLKIVGFKNLTRLVFLTLLVINGDHLYLSSVNILLLCSYLQGGSTILSWELFRHSKNGERWWFERRGQFANFDLDTNSWIKSAHWTRSKGQSTSITYNNNRQMMHGFV